MHLRIVTFMVGTQLTGNSPQNTSFHSDKALSLLQFGGIMLTTNEFLSSGKAGKRTPDLQPSESTNIVHAVLCSIRQLRCPNKMASHERNIFTAALYSEHVIKIRVCMILRWSCRALVVMSCNSHSRGRGF